MTTVSAQAQMIRRRLLANARGEYNFLSNPVDANVVTLVLDDALAKVQPGNVVAVDAETMLVRSRDNASHSIGVRRGWLGTTPAAHSAGAVVELSPRFPLPDLYDTMAEEILTWTPDLFVARTIVIPLTRGTRTYDLTGVLPTDTVLFGLALSMPTGVTAGTLGSLSDNSRTGVNYRLVRNLSTVEFPSSYALQLEHEPSVPADARFTFGTDFDLAGFGPATDLVADVGLEPAWLGALVYGVMWRLMSAAEVGRSDLHATGEVRKAEEVPAGLQTQIADRLMKLRDRLVADCALGLRTLYPYRVE